MNERQWWSAHVQPRLHRPHEGYLAWKIQDAFIMGRPDVVFNVPIIHGKTQLTGWMELKYDPAFPVRETTSVDVGLSREQFRHLDMWATVTNDPRTAVVLYGVGKDWYLFPHDSAILAPGTKWLVKDIVRAAWYTGTGYNSLSSIWAQLVARPRYKE